MIAAIVVLLTSYSLCFGEKTNEDIHEDIAKLLTSVKIRENSRHYSEYPHIPGSKRNEILGREMAKKWKEFGLDRTEIKKYRVLMSLPEKPAEIHLKYKSSVKEKLIISNEPGFGDSEKKGDPVWPYNAYSIPKNVTGQVVYVNYGYEDDYVELDKLGIDLKDKIFLIRYGNLMPRASHPISKMIKGASDRGAAGVIFYPDPQDFTQPGQEYPKGWMLNKFGVQRGSIYELEGDALSIGYPSKERYYRDDKSTYKYQFDIPSQPISAKTAGDIFEFMSGSDEDSDSTPSVPTRFKGGMNITYSLRSGKERTITLQVMNKLEDKDTYVVCGTLYGATEPDRYIMIGNHRDAWTYGASYPVSGSAVMTEIVRVLGKYKNQTKWRPRRSVMICSWGAEEAGMLGSTEWADENANFLSSKVVAYLNVDAAVEGNFTVLIKSLDHMVDSIFTASKNVKVNATTKNGKVKEITLFDDMCHKHALLRRVDNDLEHPDYNPTNSVSDNKHITQRYGVSTSDYRYVYNKIDFPGLVKHNGHYHTLYDSFDWMNKFVDPTFEHHVTLSKLWLTHALTLADSTIIPFNLIGYAEKIQLLFLDLEKKYRKQLSSHNVSVEYVKRRLKVLVSETKEFNRTVKELSIKKLPPGKLRAINDRLMYFERNFILESIVGKQQLSHIVYSTHENFYGIVYAITKDPGNNWDNVRKEITLFAWCVDTAIRALNLDELRLATSKENTNKLIRLNNDDNQVY